VTPSTTASNTATTVEIWVDPACPFCWVTSRWLVEQVVPHRDLDVAWRPISLFVKNDPPEGSEYHEVSWFTHRLLRVMEAVRAVEGDAAVGRLYREFGARIHHDGDTDFDPKEALAAVDLDTAHAVAFDDDTWDDVLRAAMDDGSALVGDDVGTPIIAMVNSRGERAGYFGPVISRVPPTDQSLRMWDALTAMMDVDGFFELKKTRDEDPDPGDRPS
jgi:hypothetical protein